MRLIAQKLIYSPLVIAVLIASGIIGVAVSANNDILIGAKVWKTGMADWGNSITLEPGQEFKITHYAVNAGASIVTSVRLVDEPGSNTAYIDDSTYQLAPDGVTWNALADDNTSFFDGLGLNIGILAPFDFKNYKYTVKVADFVPQGTSSLAWSGPTLYFTDANGATSKASMETNTVTIANVPAISSFSVNTNTYKLGDVITATASGTAGKAARVEIGSISFPLGGSGANYSGTYVVQAGDSAAGTPRVFFANNGANTGSYRDAASSAAIDGVAPPAPANLTASVNSGTLVATLTWTASSPETDVTQYNVYSNNGSGFVNYAAPVAVVPVGANQHVTPPLSADSLYIFAVRSQDAVGNIEQNASTASAATDFTAPDAPDSLVRPTTLNSTVVRFGPSNSLQFVWAPSLSADVSRYRVEIDDNPDFSSIIASLETAGALTSLSATSTMVALPDGVYSWRVSAIDDAGNVSTPQTAPNNTFEIDTANPGAAYGSPSSGNHIAGSFTATGTASDAGTHMPVNGSTTGLSKVEVFLQNFSPTPKEYWNGSAWVAAQTWLTATSADDFLTWSYNFTPTITDGDTYITGSRSTDEAGNTADSALVMLTGNTSSPNVNITAPANGSYQASAVTVAGTASDPGGTIIAGASVSIQRSSDLQYWNGAAWSAGAAWNAAGTADNFANWTYNFTPDGSTPEAVVYTITARAIDGVFGAPNTGTSSAVTTIKDTTAPAVAITSPLAANSPFNAASWDAANPIAGTAADSGAGVASVEVAVRDSSGNYWNGTDWTSLTAVWFSATSLDSFATWKYLNAGSDFIPDKDDDFTVYARATDNAISAPNTSTAVSESITYDTAAPVIANVVVTNSTMHNITTLIKNGDVFILSAVITDALQAGMALSDITADLTAITGNPSDISVAPTSYNTSTGEAVWNFASAAGTSNQNLGVSITATDPAGNAALFTNNAVIVADNTAPAIAAAALEAPSAPGIAWPGGSTQNITWTSSDITDTNLAANPITLEYSIDGSNWNLIAANEANDGTHSWAVPSINSNTVLVRITAVDQVNNTSNDTSDNQFTIDSAAPAVPANALTAPNGGEAWIAGTNRTITWNNAAITDNFNLAANPITLEYTTDGLAWNPIAGNVANDGAYAWTAPLIDFTAVKVRITAADAAGNAANDQSDANFAIGLPPVVVQARAMSDTLIEVEWDKSLASAGAFANYTATGTTATAAVISGGNDKIVNLTVNGLNNTGFTAADLAISAGTVIDTFNFVNEAAAGESIIDRQAPITDIANSYPNSDQLIVDYSPKIRIAISEAPDLGSTVFKYDAGAQAPVYNAGTGMLEFDIAATLAPGQHSITLDLVDVAGNAETTQTWNFWIDQLEVTVTANPVVYTFNGNVFDESDGTEQQTVSISSWGAGYTIYARFNPDFGDGFGNTIADVDIKQDSQGWSDKIDLAGAALVSIVNVPKPAIPYGAAPQVDTYTFDVGATIPGIAQPAGDYRGTLEFVVIPEY
ncbi:MAG: fibronectin type III domain-containing protein [Parcubacteria group bacterium]|nr:fibronectin type III domain-containing protein [Parcubacteria group bacterium]